MKPRGSEWSILFYKEVPKLMGCAPTVSTMYSLGSMPTAKRSNGNPATKRSQLLRLGEESGSWRYQRWPRGTGRVVRMHWGDRLDTLVTHRGHRGKVGVAPL